ncbi:MAG: galactose mutarotase [Fimbriimonadaceae bacterium]|nr:galactose mutarotase [Fimbriimonadaceae bacterium]
MALSREAMPVWRGIGRGIRRRPWGITGTGEAVHLFELSLPNGTRVTISEYGLLVQSWFTPDRRGSLADIVLGFDNLADYERHSPYFGCMVGRFANRIASGNFTLDGVEHQLTTNNSPGGIPCHLHGGEIGFDRRVWSAQTTGGEEPAITFWRISPDGEEEYPGNVMVRVTFQLLASGALRITTTAQTDRPTPFSMAHHGYFNLAGQGTTDDHSLQIFADSFTPINAGMIPTGDKEAVADTSFDFRQPMTLRDVQHQDHPQLALSRGFDHNFVLRRPGRAAILAHSESGRTLEVATDLPGLQFYGGQMLAIPVPGKAGQTIGPFGGLCLETQYFPDSPNQPGFPDCILRPGSPYMSVTEYRPGVLATDH